MEQEQKTGGVGSRLRRSGEEPRSWQQEIFAELKILTVVLTVVILVFHFLMQLVVVVGSSMYPTLHERDLLVAWRAYDHLETGDIIIAHKETEFIRETVVKRVIATEGQEVRIDYEENAVYVDGVRLEEDYLNFSEADPMEPRGDVAELIVPEGTVFALGDNRNHSTDSRFLEALGPVEEDYIVGKALFVFFPIDHIGWLGD